MFKYVLFDVDGTLFDPYEGITNCIKYALGSIGIEENDDEKMRDTIGPPLRQTFALYTSDADEIEMLVAKYRELYRVSGIHQNKMYDGVLDMLKTLKENGCIISVASCKPAELTEIILEEHRILGYFDFISGATFDKKRDTKEEVIAYAIENLAIPENELDNTVMVGDRDMDILGAHKHGIKAIGTLYGYGKGNELFDAKADFFVSSPKEICSVILSDKE